MTNRTKWLKDQLQGQGAHDRGTRPLGPVTYVALAASMPLAAYRLDALYRKTCTVAHTRYVDSQPPMTTLPQ